MTESAGIKDKGQPDSDYPPAFFFSFFFFFVQIRTLRFKEVVSLPASMWERLALNPCLFRATQRKAQYKSF